MRMRGFYFTTAEHIHKYYDYGVHLREILLPAQFLNFKIVQLEDKFRSSMIFLGPKYYFNDPIDIKTRNLIG